MRLRIQKATIILALMLSAIAVATPRCQGQEKPEQSEANCTVDLELTGVMSDIISNALILGFEKDESKVSAYLDAAKKNFQSAGTIRGGHEFAISAANEFGIKEETCLLYTSPSPRDRTRSRMPSSA